MPKLQVVFRCSSVVSSGSCSVQHIWGVLLLNRFVLALNTRHVWQKGMATAQLVACRLLIPSILVGNMEQIQIGQQPLSKEAMTSCDSPMTAKREGKRDP